jgi:integrase
MPALRPTEFRARLRELGLAERSVAEYAKVVAAAEAWLARHGHNLHDAPGELLARYVATRPRSWATRKQLRTAFAHYWELSRRRRPPLWAVPVPPKPRGRCRALSELEAARLERAARERGDAKGLAVLLGLYLGLRVSEIAAFRWDQLRPDGWVRVVGKGGVQADIPAHPVLARALADFPRRGEWCFPGRFGGPVVPATVWGWIREVAAGCGLVIQPHQLRHTCLATANDRTGDLRAVQELARHARPETTALYTRASARRLLAAVAALDYQGVA